MQGGRRAAGRGREGGGGRGEGGGRGDGERAVAREAGREGWRKGTGR
jgi:hypothetical protein